MARYDDERPAPCVDCALDRCARCRDDDPAAYGKRECCCGLVADVKVYPAATS